MNRRQREHLELCALLARDQEMKATVRPNMTIMLSLTCIFSSVSLASIYVLGMYAAFTGFFFGLFVLLKMKRLNFKEVELIIRDDLTTEQQEELAALVFANFDEFRENAQITLARLTEAEKQSLAQIIKTYLERLFTFEHFIHAGENVQ